MLPAKGCPHQGNWERDPASNLPRGHRRQGKKRPLRRRARIPFPFSSRLTTWTVTSWMTQTSINWKIAERPGPQSTPRLGRPANGRGKLTSKPASTFSLHGCHSCGTDHGGPREGAAEGGGNHEFFQCICSHQQWGENGWGVGGKGSIPVPCRARACLGSE